MFNLLRKNDNHREQNRPPDFIPQKQQGQQLFGPGPVIQSQFTPQGPGPVIQPQWAPQGSGPVIQPQFPPQGPGPVIGPQGPGPVVGEANSTVPQKLQICVDRFVYLWLNNGAEFWFFVQGVTPRYIFGWRLKEGRLQRGRITMSRIETFYCHKRD